MKNGNGKIVLYLVGVIVTLVLFIGFPTLVGHVVANDKDSRARDIRLQEQLSTSVLAQQKQNTGIQVVLEKLLTKMEYIEKEIKNGNN